MDQALILDPQFALAYATKAFWYTFDLVGAGGAGPDEAAQFESLVRSNAETALSIDQDLAIARAALVVTSYVNWQGTAAEESFLQAMELNPNDPAVLVMYGRFKRYRGEYEESARLLQQARELDPRNPFLRGQLALTHRASGAWREAEEIYRAILNEGAGAGLNTIVNYANVLALIDEEEEALRQLQLAEQLDPNSFRISQMARIYGLLGRDEDANRMLRILEEQDATNPVSHGNWARAYIAVENYDAALERITLAVENRIPTDLANLAEFANNTWRDPELDRPQFQAVLSDLWNDQ
jgi:tetratricopeptide (TPR) repeat protein